MRQASGKSRQVSVRIRQLSCADRAAMAERVLGHLERLHPFNPALHVARETGLHRPTIAKWFERRSLPDGAALGRLIAVYGPDFLEAALGLKLPWLTLGAWHARRAAFEADQAAFEAEMGPLVAAEGRP